MNRYILIITIDQYIKKKKLKREMPTAEITWYIQSRHFYIFHEILVIVHSAEWQSLFIAQIC